MNRFLFLLPLLFVASTAQAQQRCVENGRVLITDRPCGEATTGSVPKPDPMPVTRAAPTASLASGTWRGHAQYQASQNGVVIQAAHAVTPLVIEIDPQGKITGISNETGCHIKGIAAPGMAPTITNIDVTFSGCSYNGYNRRMFGHLIVAQGRGTAQLSVSAHHIIPAPAAVYELRATLRR